MGEMLITKIGEMVDVPHIDVNIALASLECRQLGNGRLYDVGRALQALEKHYARRIAENRMMYGQRHAKSYGQRMRLYTERLERVKRARNELEAGHGEE